MPRQSASLSGGYRGLHRRPLPRQQRAARWLTAAIVILLVTAVALGAWSASQQGLTTFLH